MEGDLYREVVYTREGADNTSFWIHIGFVKVSIVSIFFTNDSCTCTSIHTLATKHQNLDTNLRMACFISKDTNRLTVFYFFTCRKGS